MVRWEPTYLSLEGRGGLVELPRNSLCLELGSEAGFSLFSLEIPHTLHQPRVISLG